jgi:uncharacterized protein
MPVMTDLLELQQVELQILRDRKAIDQIPQAEQIKEVRSRLKELSKKTTKIVGLLKDARIEVEDNDGRRLTLSARVEEVTREGDSTDDHRRAQDYKAELDRLAKRLEKVDFNQKKAKAELERLEGLYRQARDIKNALEEKEAALVEEFKQAAGDVKAELEQLVARRETLEQSIPADMLKQYRDSCAKHNHVGICKLEGNSCTGCRVELQQAQIEAIMQGDSLATCPVCGRMMVVRGA